MTANVWRNGGNGRVIQWEVIATSRAPMLVAATEKGVCCLAFGEGEDELRARFPKADLVRGGEAFRALFEEVTRAVEQPGVQRDIPLDVKGTALDRKSTRLNSSH